MLQYRQIFYQRAILCCCQNAVVINRLGSKWVANNLDLYRSTCNIAMDPHVIETNYVQEVVFTTFREQSLLFHGWGVGGNRGGGKNFSASKLRGAKFQCTEIWRPPWGNKNTSVHGFRRKSLDLVQGRISSQHNRKVKQGLVWGSRFPTSSAIYSGVQIALAMAFPTSLLCSKMGSYSEKLGENKWFPKLKNLCSLQK